MQYGKPKKVIQKKVAATKASGGSRIMLTETHPVKSLPECGCKPKPKGKLLIEQSGK